MKGFLVFTKPDEDGNTIAVDLSTGDFHKLAPKPPAPPAQAEEPEADNDGCFKALILLLAVGAAAVMGLMPRSAYAQQWQPTTWPPQPAPACSNGRAADFPGGCVGVERMRAGLQAMNYELSNQQAKGYGVDVPLDVDTAGAYAQRQMDNWDPQTGRYNSEAWMWTPAPAASQQWVQQRREWRQ